MDSAEVVSYMGAMQAQEYHMMPTTTAASSNPLSHSTEQFVATGQSPFKAASKREQSQTRLNSAEHEQARPKVKDDCQVTFFEDDFEADSVKESWLMYNDYRKVNR